MSEIASGYHVGTEMVDGNDVMAATEAALKAAEYVRRGHGPFFLEFHTYRWQGIFSGDIRDPEEVRVWKEDRDPIKRCQELIRDKGLMNQERIDELHAEVKELVDEWTAFAREAPSPDPSTALDFVYATPEVFSE
jgi:pyruvate dehydrogenase E1 component alpha subunit